MRKRNIKRGAAALAAAALFFAALTHGGQAVRTIAGARQARVLVIDAGHGGFDGGAVSADGVSEQNINLSVARSTQALAGFFGVRTQMTRTDENALDYDPARPVRENKVADIKAREQLVLAQSDPVFISIHLNQFTDAQYHGAQVFYSGGHAGSRALADRLQQALIDGVDRENRRGCKQAENTIYLMKKLTCPAVIVECGFLSNPTEAARLTQPSYQKQLAVCIVCGYLRYEADG